VGHTNLRQTDDHTIRQTMFTLEEMMDIEDAAPVRGSNPGSRPAEPKVAG
jgi:hypothetical protein